MEKSLINAIAYVKRSVKTTGYSFNELIENAKYKYYLREDETEILKNKLFSYCKKNHLSPTGLY